MSKAVAIRQTGEMQLADYKPKSLIDLAQSTAIMQRLLKGIMKVDVHFGTIPGTPKPTLFKAGAEKILSTFLISAEPIVEDLSTDDCSRYRVKVIGCTPDGTIIGYGIGECSTDEEKYKWRASVCDQEFEATMQDRRREKWSKGCQNSPPKSVKQIRTNHADLSNTALKMAKKRGMIDMVLTATAASDLFSQDLEDLKDIIDITDYQKPTGGKPEVKTPQSTQEQGGDQKDPAAKISAGGAVYLTKQLDTKKIPHADFCAYMKVAAIGDITNSDFNAACAAVKKWEAQP